MRTAKWLFLVMLLGVFLGMLWAGHQTALAPPVNEDVTPPASPGLPPPPADPTPPCLLEPYLHFVRHTSDEEQLMPLLDKDGSIPYHAHLALARLYREDGALTEAVSHYEEALSLYSTAAVRTEYAQVLEEKGRLHAACEQWQRLLPQAEASQAVIRLCEPLQAAGELNQAGLFREALSVLEWKEGPTAQREKARAYAGLGEHSRASAAFENYLAHHPEAEGVRLEYARSLERAGNTDRALDEYSKAGEDGMRARGRLLERLGNTGEAIEAYARSSDPEGLWRAGQLLEARGEATRAHELYKTLAAGSARVADDAALRLYLHYQRQGEEEMAQRYLEKLSLALTYLVGEFDGSWRVVDDPELSDEPVALRRADALLEHFNIQWARIEIEILLLDASTAERIAAGKWLVEHSMYDRVVRLGMGMLTPTPSLSVYRLAYPQAYSDLVMDAAEEFEVDPHLIWAVMREESHFRPRARSWADARGLMQVLPSTGEWIAERLGEEYHLQDLYKPQVSIRYGAWYLSHLLEMFDGEISKAIAAYNGGPGSVNRWLGSPVYQEVVDLPGVCAFQETREYIDKVLSSWLVYRWLYETG